MGRAQERLSSLDPMGARDEARGAAEKLEQTKRKMNQAGRPSTSQGAVTPSWRNAARNVMVCQWPCGTFALMRSPTGAQP